MAMFSKIMLPIASILLAVVAMASDVCNPDLTLRQAALDLEVITDSTMLDAEVKRAVIERLSLLSNEDVFHQIQYYSDTELIGKIYNAYTLLDIDSEEFQKTESELQQMSTEAQKEIIVEIVNEEFNDVLTVDDLENKDEKDLNCLTLRDCDGQMVCEDINIREAALDWELYTAAQMAPLSDEQVRAEVVEKLGEICIDPPALLQSYSDEELIGKMYTAKILESSDVSVAEMMTLAQRQLIIQDIMAQYAIRIMAPPFLMGMTDKDLSCLASC